MWQIETGLQEQLDFLKEWPLKRLENMTLDEYSNSDRDTGFIYWIEKKTEHTGSIWGGSAFKFIIYRRKNLESNTFEKKTKIKTDGVYGWLAKYGATKEEVFEKVKKMVIDIARFSASNKFNEIDSIDWGDTVKWKIAFLYNPNMLIPIFNSKVLARAAESTGLSELEKDNISGLQRHLFNIKPNELNTLQFAKQLWDKFNLDTFYSTLEKFIAQGQTDNQKRKGYPSIYKNLSVKVGFGFGNVSKVPWIAFLKDPNTVTNGIYPVYLYFKSYNVLILAYGISEANVPSERWAKEDEMQTIENWFLENEKIIPEKYGSSYIKAVYDLENDLDPDKVQADLDSIIEEYNNQFSTPSTVSEPTPDYLTKKYWLIHPGEGGSLWDEFYNDGIIAIGWDLMGDLSDYSDKEEIRSNLMNKYERGTSETNNALCLWEFSKEMKEGDIVIPKRSIDEYLGYGIVSSKYYFDHERKQYKHIRKVEWKKRGVWKEEVHQIVTKTLTDITKYPEYVDRLKRLIGIEQAATVDESNIEYYWLNANPKYWKIGDFEVGQEQSYTTLNEKGNKRSRAEYFQRIKPGDLVIGYETTPIQKVVAIFEITKGAHLDDDTGKEEITFKIQKFLPNPISYETLRSMSELNNSEVMRNNQGSLFKLTKEEYKAIIEKDITKGTSFAPYSIQDAQKEIFLDIEELENIQSCLEYKRNIILQGPPGVGKTFMAKRLAFLIMEEKDLSKIEMIQFHQSYTYEDFVQGIRPKEDGTFKLENGIFYRFCKRAQADPGKKYFFIIDEINRGNLSKIFGELMLLMEVDKRGEENAVSLTYSAATENKFYIPDNVYFIGTMNTADRSLALVDYALRRRFAFINLSPKFNNRFKEELINLGVDESIITPLVEKISSLNNQIEIDTNLGKGFRIGHSYFCNVPKNSGDEDWYFNIIKNEIAPLLEEYWFDNEEKAELEINRLYLE